MNINISALYNSLINISSFTCFHESDKATVTFDFSTLVDVKIKVHLRSFTVYPTVPTTVGIVFGIESC